MDPKSQRRRLANDWKSSIQRAYRRASERGIDGPVVLLLDLRFALARNIALLALTPGEVQQNLTRAKDAERAPVLVLYMPACDAASLVATRSAKAGARLNKPATNGSFRMAIIGFGGITCTTTAVGE